MPILAEDTVIISTKKNQSRLSVVRLWQLISPALPIGSFSYSQGLEFAIDSGWLKTEEDVAKWLSTQMGYGLAKLDVPVMIRLMQAWQQADHEKVEYWNDHILAYRESAELLDEDCQVGYALTRLLTDLDIPYAAEWQDRKVSYVTQYALACTHWHIDFENAAAGFLWAWCENMVAAAIKLLPMGQTAGQKMLLKMGDVIEQSCEHSLSIKDDEIGAILPAIAMASAFHETQYSRLFRS
ncbi:MAG: urease accessory protein UreF [Gammaproteobacteria bacterium]|nr:urease accessory protein UreF [Gammaproteobacteria bacterium]